MDYIMKLEEGKLLSIVEHETQTGKVDVIELAFNEKRDFSVAHVHLNKKELHKLIGTLLHIQSKMR